MIGDNIIKAKELLEKGEIIGLPTETVYGLAGNGFAEDACTAIFQAKNRPSFDPLILHSYGLEGIQQFTQNIPEAAIKLAKAFWPGPLTLLLERNELVPDIVTSGLPRVAVRVPNHPTALKLLQQLPFPLAAPSANPFGYISPTTAQHVSAQLGNKVAYILDGGNCNIGIESTIVGFENDEAIIYRKGGLAIEAIESIIGKVNIKAHSDSNPKAPGMLKRHYSPTTPIILGDIPTLIDTHKNKNIAVLSFNQKYNNNIPHKILSPLSDDGEAAKNLFAYLRTLDGLNLDLILAELVPEKGLGLAINDRLLRSAAGE